MIVGRVVQDDWRGPALAGGLIAAILILYALTGRTRAHAHPSYLDAVDAQTDDFTPPVSGSAP